MLHMAGQWLQRIKTYLKVFNMPITVPANIRMAVPAYKIDQIIGIYTGSFIVGSPPIGGSSTASDTFTTGFGDSCLFQGIFSIDAGSSWNDFGTYRPNLTTAGQPVLQTTTCYGMVSPTGVFTATAKNWYDNVHASGASYTVRYKVLFIAKETQGIITPIATSEILYYTSKYNYQKYLPANGSSFASTSGTTTIAHNLGYVPKVRAWFSPTSTSNNADSISIPAGSIVTLDNYQYATNVYANATSVIFTDVSPSVSPRVSVNGTMYYRAYIDS